MTGTPDLPLDKREAERLDAIEARLDALEGAEQLTATTMKGGTFRLETADDHPVFVFGHFTNADGEEVYGVSAVDTEDDGDYSTVLSWDSASRGLIYPHEYHQWIVPTSQAISSGTFVTVAECECIQVNEETMCAAGAVIVPAGSVGQIRIRDANSSEVANSVTVNANVIVLYEWIHPFSVGWGDSGHPLSTPLLQWQARLVSGAGPITVFPPRHLTFRHSRFCSGASTGGGGRIA